jgi:hypothetical protein
MVGLRASEGILGFYFRAPSFRDCRSEQMSAVALESLGDFPESQLSQQL